MNRGLCTTLASLLALAVFIPVAPAQSQARGTQLQESGFTITGIAVSSTTGSPVAHCRITASPSNRIPTPANRGFGPNSVQGGPAGPRRMNQQQDSAETDEHGHFALTVPSAGSWSLRATGTGYRSQAFDEHEQFSSAIVLTEQAPTYDLLFRLTPDSSITGLILDEAGEPVRQARVSLFATSSSSPAVDPVSQRTSQAMTDDRGRYEIANLAPGNYRLSVQARPWYATTITRLSPASNSEPPPQLDPSLDVVYPPIWFPGTADENSAVTITLRDGEDHQADIRLLPIPSVHLLIPVPPNAISSTPGNPRPSIGMPRVEPVTPNETPFQPSVSMYRGQYDVGGLGPGLYRVFTPGDPAHPGTPITVQVTSNSSRSLDISAAAVNATVTIQSDGAPGAESVPLLFVDATNPRNVFRSNESRGDFFAPGGSPPNFGGSGGPQQGIGTVVGGAISVAPPPPPPAGDQRQSGGRGGQRERPARTLVLPPGDYLVYQEGSSGFYLTSLTLGTKDIAGRLVSIPDGFSTLTVHIATGRANITGIATLDSKPAIGAMVLLVPVTLGQRGSIDEIRRDQTNTDGSFDLAAVIPGQYILIAIDHGWNVRWSDPATLSRYLVNGIPLDLRTSNTLKQNLDAQLP